MLANQNTFYAVLLELRLSDNDDLWTPHTKWIKIRMISPEKRFLKLFSEVRENIISNT